MNLSEGYFEENFDKETEKTEYFQSDFGTDVCDCSMAELAENKGDFMQAVLLYKASLDEGLKRKDFTVVAEMYERLGVIYTTLNDFSEALFCFRKAISYRSLENDLQGFCRVHRSLSRMYFFEALHKNKEYLLSEAEYALDIVLSHLNGDRFPDIYVEAQINYLLIKAQRLRFLNEEASEKYLEILSDLTSFTNCLKDNSPSYQRLAAASKNNLAVIFALVGNHQKAEKLILDCLNQKAVIYSIVKNPQNLSYALTKANLKSIIQKNPDLTFEY